ncbi:unnamed protein product [Ectocarpus fasciculatus]
MFRVLDFTQDLSNTRIVCFVAVRMSWTSPCTSDCLMSSHDHSSTKRSQTLGTHLAFSGLICGSTESVSSDIRVRIIEDLCPTPAENLPIDARERAQAATVVGRRREKAFYICRELQLGAAVGVGRTVMTAGCGRRPIRGVLGALALNRRRRRGPTAIEPEVALIMANLAKVRSSSRVLDPFCGSCSLLLPAAHMGAQTWGSDVRGPATASEVAGAGALVGGDTGGDGGCAKPTGKV